MQRLAAILLALVGLSACASKQHVAQTEFATIRGSFAADVEFVKFAVIRYGPQVAAMLGTQQVPVEIKILDSVVVPASVYGILGAADDGRIWLGRASCRGYGHVVAHELVHAYGSQEQWFRNLPPLVVEGTCEFVATEVTQATEMHRRRVKYFAPSTGQQPEEVWLAGSSLKALRAYPDLYSEGFRLVDRVGLEAIRELAESGRLTPESVAALPTRAGLALNQDPGGAQNQRSNPDSLPTSVTDLPTGLGFE